MARRLGMDVDSLNSQIRRLIQLGIRDHNPERALRSCEHLCARLRDVSPLAISIGLPTAGFKDLICIKHGYGIRGADLDQLHSRMVDNHCANCQNRHPHKDTWKWSPEWQSEQERCLAK
jgi:hypothetical protein